MTILQRMDKASTRQVRLLNTRLVLQGISDGCGQVSRADLMRLTGLNTATISSVVSDLIKRGLVVEAGFGPSAGGKPPMLLDLGQRHSVLALQVARTGYRLAALGLDGSVRRQRHGRLDHLQGPQEILARLLPALTDFIGDAPSPLALGIAVPGIVSDRGTVARSVTLGWRDFSLRETLREHVDLPMHLINDSRSAAFAEISLVDEKTPSLMALYVGDGVGAGLVLEGQLYAGDTFSAGEVGHVNLRTHDLACECGRRGCLEAAATVRVLTGHTAPAFGDPPTSIRLDRRAARRAARNITALMELNHDLLDLRRTIICGPVCHLGTEFLDIIREELQSSQLYASGGISVDFSRLGDRGALLGAAAFAAYEELGLLWTSQPEPTS